MAPSPLRVAMAQRWRATRSKSRGSKHVQRPGDPVDPVDLSHGGLLPGLFQKINFHENPERTHADGFGYCHVLTPWTTLSSNDWKGISVKRSEMDSEFGLCIVRHHNPILTCQNPVGIIAKLVQEKTS